MNQTEQISQKLNNVKLSQDKLQLPQKKLYEVATSLGKINIQITRFTQYIIIVLTYASVLKLDGYLQLAYPTPYNENPSVLNLQKEQGQMENQKLSQLLSKQTKRPIFLSFNLQNMNKNQEQELYQLLKKILIGQ